MAEETPKDPIFPNTPANDGATGGGVQTPPAPPTGDIASQIGQRLSESEQSKATAGEQVLEAENPFPFDLSKMSREQIQNLKAMLAVTPDRPMKKRENPRVKIRRIDGRYVSDFKRAYLGLVDDPENQRKVERHIIPVRYFGETEYHNMLYSTFINSEQVLCEVLETRNVVDEFIEGETVSRETGLPVEMIRKEVKYFFTIKLPDESKVELEARVANG